MADIQVDTYGKNLYQNTDKVNNVNNKMKILYYNHRGNSNLTQLIKKKEKKFPKKVSQQTNITSEDRNKNVILGIVIISVFMFGVMVGYGYSKNECEGQLKDCIRNATLLKRCEQDHRKAENNSTAVEDRIYDDLKESIFIEGANMNEMNRLKEQITELIKENKKLEKKKDEIDEKYKKML